MERLGENAFSPHDNRDMLQNALENVDVNDNMIAPMLGT